MKKAEGSSLVAPALQASSGVSKGRRLAVLSAALAAVGGLGQAHAQTAASSGKVMRFVVGYSPGGSADSMARILAPLMSKELGQTILVENRPGASGALGVAAVTHAEPDGNTLLYAAISEITVAPAITKVAYDPQKDLAPIGFALRSSFILLASPTFPPNTLAELIAYVKANPNKTSYASFGINSVTHVAGERFKQLAGIDSVHVPYKGGAQAQSDLASGNVQFYFDSAAATLGLIRAGKLKPIAVASPERLSALPNVPTTREAGMPDLLFASWMALFAPAKTPAPVIAKLNAALRVAMSTPEMQEALNTRSFGQGGGSPAELAAHVAKELDVWRAVAPLMRE